MLKFLLAIRRLLGLARKPPEPGEEIPSRDGTRTYVICSPPDCSAPKPNPSGLLTCPPGSCSQVNPNCSCQLFSYRPGFFGDGPWQWEEQPVVEDPKRTSACFCARQA